MDFMLLLIFALNFIGLRYLIDRINTIEDRVIDIQGHAISAANRRKAKQKSVSK